MTRQESEMNLELMRNILTIFASLLLFHQSRAKEIALTFDDCPRKVGTLMSGAERAKRLIRQLNTASVGQVGFFCNSPTRQSDGFERIKYFADQGYLIANHSATHMNLDNTPVDLFINDIERADKELHNFPNFRKWFRFPFLREGKTVTKINAVREFLAKAGYKNGYVTVDTQDWYMDDLLAVAVAEGKKFNQERLCTTYKELMTEEAEFFDNMSVQALGRSVKHVLLLHETDLNAFCIGELVSELRAHDWKIISPDVAYMDPIADREPSASVPLNQGCVFALAKERGYKGPYWSRWNEEAEIEKEFIRRKIWE